MDLVLLGAEQCFDKRISYQVQFSFLGIYDFVQVYLRLHQRKALKKTKVLDLGSNSSFDNSSFFIWNYGNATFRGLLFVNNVRHNAISLIWIVLSPALRIWDGIKLSIELRLLDVWWTWGGNHNHVCWIFDGVACLFDVILLNFDMQLCSAVGNE